MSGNSGTCISLARIFKIPRIQRASRIDRLESVLKSGSRRRKEADFEAGNGRNVRLLTSAATSPRNFKPALTAASAGDRGDWRKPGRLYRYIATGLPRCSSFPGASNWGG